jgi:hypothetical protein
MQISLQFFFLGGRVCSVPFDESDGALAVENKEEANHCLCHFFALVKKWRSVAPTSKILAIIENPLLCGF